MPSVGMSGNEIPASPVVVRREKGASTDDKKCPKITCKAQPTEKTCVTSSKRASELSLNVNLADFEECCPVWECDEEDKGKTYSFGRLIRL